LKNVGTIDQEDVADKLLELYVIHCRLSNAINALDRTFEVYVFAMLGTNIPTTIFTLLSLLVDLRGSGSKLILPCFSALFCIVQLIGLVIIPAKLHNAISKAKTLLYGNISIWYPHDIKVARFFSTWSPSFYFRNIKLPTHLFPELPTRIWAFLCGVLPWSQSH